MGFLTALRQPTIRKLELLGEVDIVVGIPTYMSTDTVRKVIETVCQGLYMHFPEKRSLIFVSNGGSTDDTREVARSLDLSDYGHEKIVAIYRELPGKGSALRSVFEAARFLRAKAIALFDADLRSITPKWIRNILLPIFEVTSYYNRYKYDGTITNGVVYPLTRALFGKRIRQPIGGDFGVSAPLSHHYVRQGVWKTDVARSDIDVWIYKSFNVLWKNILPPVDFTVYKDLYHEENPEKFVIPSETWARTVYHYAKTFYSMPDRRSEVLDTLTPLYNLNVANVYNRPKETNQEQAEAFFEDLAQTFENLKGYFAALWMELKERGDRTETQY
ncbi:MAG: glycosyltransferase [Thermotogae bacterium]|nr:glycosyltransferase [Thermotogota bacterium]